MKKIFISADIEGVNNICAWDETNELHPDYQYFKRQMNEEVRRAVLGAKRAGFEEIFVKDAHGNARNLDPYLLGDDVILHRGWEGTPEMMMEGLDSSFTAVIFIGYHSGMLNPGNALAHTLNPKLHKILINNVLASEFLINSYYASTLGVPIAFLSGDESLTKAIKEINPNIEICSTLTGKSGASIARHPSITNLEIEDKVFKSLQKDLSNNLVELPKEFKIEIEYRSHQEAYSASFFPGCKLIDYNRIRYETKNFYDALVLFKFVA